MSKTELTNWAVWRAQQWHSWDLKSQPYSNQYSSLSPSTGCVSVGWCMMVFCVCVLSQVGVNAGVQVEMQKQMIEKQREPNWKTPRWMFLLLKQNAYKCICYSISLHEFYTMTYSLLCCAFLFRCVVMREFIGRWILSGFTYISDIRPSSGL